MKVLKNKKENIFKARDFIKKLVNENADFIVFPEMFNCPYDNSFFRDFSENYDSGETIKFLSNEAKENNVYIVGGSIPELYEGKVFNTSFVFDRNGNLIAKHRKIHLFDIDVKDKIRFKESDVLSAGNNITIFNTEFGKMGIIICYDIRFPELSRIMALKGAKIIFVPGAFNMTTGPAHWELLFRSRALDNQIYMVGVSPARDMDFSYHAYGNSMITDPWGEVVERFDEKENFKVVELDMKKIDECRESLPYFKHRRTDIYSIEEK